MKTMSRIHKLSMYSDYCSIVQEVIYCINSKQNNKNKNSEPTKQMKNFFVCVYSLNLFWKCNRVVADLQQSSPQMTGAFYFHKSI